jgi:hypothetical protein
MIETSTAASAEALAALFDQLIDAVAQRVMSQITAAAIQSHIEDWADAHLHDKLNDWATYHLDVSHDVKQAIDDLDLSDKVREEIQNLNFHVTVE